MLMVQEILHLTEVSSWSGQCESSRLHGTAELTRFHKRQWGHIYPVCHSLHCDLTQRRGAALLWTSMQAGNSTPSTGHQLGFCLRTGHGQPMDGNGNVMEMLNVMENIGLQPSLLQFCTFTGCGRLWCFSGALNKFSCSGRRKKSSLQVFRRQE